MLEAINTTAVKFDKPISEGLSRLSQQEKREADTFYTDISNEPIEGQMNFIVLIQSAIIQGSPTYPTSTAVGHTGSLLDPEKKRFIGWLLDNEASFTQESSETQSSHIPTVSIEKVELDIENIFSSVGEEAFENGIVTKFSESIQTVIIQHGDTAVRAISHYILDKTTNPEVAGEALRWVGEIDDGFTLVTRRNLLEKALIECSSPLVRDGANIGLAQIDDPHSIPFFKRAIEDEKSDFYRVLLQQTLDQLENTLKCRNS